MNTLRPYWLADLWQRWFPFLLAKNLQINDSVLRASYPQQNLMHLAAFSEIEIYPQTIQIHEQGGEITGIFHGRHTGHFAGIPPTYRHIELPVKLTFVMQDFRLTQLTLSYQANTFLQQLGLVP